MGLRHCRRVLDIVKSLLYHDQFKYMCRIGNMSCAIFFSLFCQLSPLPFWVVCLIGIIDMFRLPAIIPQCVSRPSVAVLVMVKHIPIWLYVLRLHLIQSAPDHQNVEYMNANQSSNVPMFSSAASRAASTVGWAHLSEKDFINPRCQCA